MRLAGKDTIFLFLCESYYFHISKLIIFTEVEKKSVPIHLVIRKIIKLFKKAVILIKKLYQALKVNVKCYVMEDLLILI